MNSAAGIGQPVMGGEGFLPASGGQLPDIFVGMGRQPPQDIKEVGVGFDVQSLAGDHEGEEIGCFLSAGLLPHV